MTDISNKTLALLMVAAVVVSLGGLFVSLDRLGQISSAGTTAGGPTGYSVAVGKANVSIQSTATITLVDDIIDFGSCSPPLISTGIANITSNNTNGGGYCDGTFPDWIELRNDGNNNLNVTVKTNVTSGEFLGQSNSNGTGFYFTTRNGTGCVNNVNWCPGNNCCNTGGSSPTNCTYTESWQALNETPWVEYNACSNLTYGGFARNFTLYARIDIPSDLQSGHDRRAALNFSSYVLP